ncbi:hypothetical protein HG536_0F04750 [Torulaspora globosa]|uniref:NADPH-dependent FMN reductase-like domain-containing protein n=1 Tax=Torulaspora globosa TaxID=48254 RepID=A0A7G3ZKW2_9SACH|nr:uncharacterized protein HG536_0F04750 [Torulaspora globosa]QLL34148.1 hypothetical protein HG536_0F04750 [Torulaspora globosa]
MTVFRIGVILGSTRSTRLSPRIAQYVIDRVRSSEWDISFTLSLIDLKEWDLPLMDEPKVPALVTKTEDYESEVARKWSREISSYDGFIFVTPQYNWGYPACLKNAIDYLFNEWKGKPAMLVSYGGHGGHKCYNQLRQVLEGLDMEVTERGVLVPYPTKKEVMYGIPADFHFDQLPEIRETIETAFENLLNLLKKN